MAKKMSVEEILAAARAEKAKGAGAPAGGGEVKAMPAAEETGDGGQGTVSAAEPASSPSAPAGGKVTPGGKGMSMAEILAAAKAKPGGVAPVAATPAAPKPAATKPAAAPAAKAAKPDYARPPVTAVVVETTPRRSFFAAAAGVLFGSSLAIGFTSLAVTHLMWLLGFARFMFPNILIEPPTRFKVGFPDSLSPGQVETKFIPQFGVWVVRYEYDGQPMIFAIKSVCTHLGCTPNWLEAEQKFKCPCHGSGFYKDGINFEGPAPRPLERYAISLADDGQLLVDKSRQFQQELGQWKDAASYVSV
jgi:cytochrome b6-f complex iron-sulfur subunit